MATPTTTVQTQEGVNVATPTTTILTGKHHAPYMTHIIFLPISWKCRCQSSETTQKQAVDLLCPLGYGQVKSPVRVGEVLPST